MNLLDIPVDPDAVQARHWIVVELSKPEYQAAKPTWFDRLSSAVWDWLSSLRLGTDGVTQGPVLVVVTVVVLAAIVAAFLVFGRPRLGATSDASGPLFRRGDERRSADIRRSALAAAARAEWTIGIEEMFRAIARRLDERTIVSAMPGSTARDVAVKAGEAIPALADDLAAAAVAFDEVRYLGGEGTEAVFRRLEALEADTRSERPEPAGARR